MTKKLSQKLGEVIFFSGAAAEEHPDPPFSGMS